MKKILLPLLLLFSITSLFAQPVNDDCSGLIDLGVIPFCPDSIWYTNVDATESDIGANNFPGGCDGGDITFVGRDVWFQFTTNDTLIDVNITVTGIADLMGSPPMSNPQIAVYRGDCLFDELSLLKCGKSDDGATEISVNVIGLDPNTPYFIRVNDWSSSATPNAGSFQLCIDEQDPEFTVCDVSSVACAGVLYDCGGPDDDYGNDEDESFTICPSAPSNACITFTLTYFNIEDGGDQITFYDGPDTSSPIIENIGGSGVTGGGGVCFQVQASSGCLTVGFSSDATVTMEGFCGSWECSTQPCDAPDPIDTEINPTDEELANFVTTPQTFATITNVDCAAGAYGTFTGVGTDLGLDKGIILTSGSVANAVGPNTGGSNTVINGTPGDADLDALSDLYSNGAASNDACVIELDVYVATNELSFEFIFGSEEYPVYVNSNFNDVFGLLVSGPGITGLPELNGQQNVAFVPGTATTPIEVNTVNFLTNWEYFRQNEAGPSTAYNGLTSDFLGVKKSLTASIPVIPCTTYHLKFAIGDRTDSSLDSGVFIGELKGDVPNLVANFASGVDYLIEDCTGTADILNIILENPQPDSQLYDVTITGTATLGVDYTLDMPAQVWLLPGETLLAYPIVPLTDGVAEGIETIIVTLTNNFGCGDIELNQIVIEIHDQPLVEIFAGQDTAYVCNGTCLQMEANGGATYQWSSTFPGVFDDPTIPNPMACPTQSQWVSVTGFVTMAAGCNDTDSVFLQFVDPQVTVVNTTPIGICVGESVGLFADNNVGNTGLIWTPDEFLDDNTIPNPTATPPAGAITYTATVNVSGCTASDQITIDVNSYDPPMLTTLDTLLCQGSVIQLADSIQSTSTVYQWSPDDYIISDTDISGAVAIPQEDIVYTLISSSQNNFCADTFEVNVSVLPALIEIENGDYIELCLGDSVLLTTLNSTNNLGITWSPDLYLDTLEGGQVWATPPTTTQYFATLTIGQCTVVDSVTIQVDSLPVLDILPIPTKPVFCLGEIVNLISPTYVPGNYPDIEFLWDPVIGQNSDLTNLNLNITASETFTYSRITTNGGCIDTTDFEIVVIDPNSIEVTPMDTIVCIGEPVQLNAFSVDTDTFTWSPANVLSCEECPDPIATVNSNTSLVVEAEVQGCLIKGFVTIQVQPLPNYDLTDVAAICLGQSVDLNNAATDPSATYDWTSNPTGFVSNASTPSDDPLVTTTYYLTIDNDACDAITDSVTVFVNGVSTLDIIEDLTLCIGDTTDLFAISNNIGTYTWSDGQTGSDIMVSQTVAGDYPYTVTFISAGDCDTITESVLVTVVPPVVITGFNYTPDDQETTFNEGQPITITPITVPDPTPAGVNYNWTSGGITLGTGATLIDTALIDPTLISLVITSPNGCVFGFQEAYEVVPAIWTIPNAFTPDADQVNDRFRVIARGSVDIKTFQIFDRWGELVYNDVDPNGWDGKYKDKPMPADVYIYHIVVETPLQGELTKTGNVTLIR